MKRGVADNGATENFIGKLVFFVNGKKIEDSSVDPEWTLVHYLRYKLRLYGTKIGCEEGACGCCTIMISTYDRDIQKEIHFPANACLTPLCSVHGQAITTIEGIGSLTTKLHPVQERIAKTHGCLCGFCTPGMVMSMYAQLRQNPKPKMEYVASSLIGNLCRCTGYRSIIDAFRTFTEEWHAENKTDKNISNDCEIKNKNGVSSSQNKKSEERLFKPENFEVYDPSLNPVFPPELINTNKYDKQFLKIKGPRSIWFRPTTLDQILTIKDKNPEAQIIAGNTISVFECRYDKVCSQMVHCKAVPEMVEICITKFGVKIGSGASMMNAEQFLKETIEKYPEEETRLFRAVNDIIHWMCSKQVRSIGSMGGNIMTGSAANDLAPILMTGGIQLEVHSKKDGKRFIPYDTKFSLGLHKNKVKQDEALVAVHLPFSKKNQYFQVYKQSRRRDVDRTVALMAINVAFEENTNIISHIFFGIGGLDAKAIDAPKTQEELKGLPWTKDVLKKAYPLLLADAPLNWVAPGGMIRYRRTAMLGLFLKIYLAIAQQLQCNLGSKVDQLVEDRELSGMGKFETRDYKSTQSFNVVPETQLMTDSVHKPMVHTSAFKKATGEAVFIDDIPRYENELSIAYIFSKIGNANIVSIDNSDALKIKGVHAYFSEKDIPPELNQTGRYSKDDQIFNSKKVTSAGQIIGAILAEDRPLAQKASRLVKVKYEELEPLIITIEDAIKHNSFFNESTIQVCHGDVANILQCAPNVLKGTCRTGNQKHYYFEVQSCLVVPQEHDIMEIYSSTQSPTDLVNVAANLLGVHHNKITVHVKRLGGAFDGKEWKSIVVAQPAILAAKKFRRPVRCILERNQDMLMSGGRVPHLFNYTVGFDNEGRILALDFDIYLNCGYSLEMNVLALKKTLNHLDNAFKISAIKARARLCKTNIPSNSAMTGFGVPEGQFPISCIIEEIAEHLKKDAAEIAKINMYNECDFTFYGQKLENCNIGKCWEECLETSKYWEERDAINKFNCENAFRKRGLSIVPAKFGVCMADLPSLHLPATALINVHTDGSVLLSYGGVEMGQGLHTKMTQVATRVLGIAAEKIHIQDTATNIMPNSAPTVSSIGSEFYGPAVIDACRKIKERLLPLKEANPNATWEELIVNASNAQVKLTATGFFRHKNKGWDTKTGVGNMFKYFVYGAACSNVEVDVLTGDHRVIRTNIVLDLGKSLNPAIDIGLIEGAFIQGYGLFIMEKTLYSPSGYLISNGLASYKLPGIRNIPVEFNVSLLKNSENPKGLYGSKMAIEPGLFLASSIFFAIKDAIKAYRKENGYSTVFHLDSPATVETIRMACEDDITKLVPKSKKPHTPWTVVV